MSLETLSRDLEQKSGELKTFISAIPKDDGGAYKMTPDQRDELTRRNDELKSLNAQRTDAAAVASAAELATKSMNLGIGASASRSVPFSAQAGGAHSVDTRSVGQRFTESDAYKNHSGSTDVSPIRYTDDSVSVKSWMTGQDEGAMKATLTSAGFAPFVPRSPLIVPMGQIQPVITDLIPSENTVYTGTKYMEEILYTNTAAIVPEGTLKPEAALQYIERTVTMAKIAVTLPVTDEQLKDVPQLRSMIDNRLGLMVRQKEDTYLLINTAANGWDGFLVKTGVQTLAKGAMSIPEAVLKMIAQISYQPGFANVSGIVIHPNDWVKYATYQISTGAFLAGNPATNPVDQIWGRPLVVTNAIPEGTMLLGDFAMYAQILRREELSIDIGYANDDFLKNIQRIRAEERMLLAVLRASAFGTITGVNV